MTIRILFLTSMLFLQGCSTLCLVGKNQDDSDIVTIDLGHDRLATDEQRLWQEEISKTCKFVSYRSNDVGIFPDATRMFIINSKPDCLLEKSKRDAKRNKGNLITQSSTTRPETGSSNDSSVYICDEALIERIKAYNKFKNANASEAGSDAA